MYEDENGSTVGGEGINDIPIAGNLVNPDIRKFVDVSSSASGHIMFRRLMAFRTKGSMDAVREEKERVFGDDQAPITDINEQLLGSGDGSVSAENDDHALVYAIVNKFAQEYDSRLNDNPSIDDILTVIENVCREAIREQMKALYGNSNGNLDGSTSNAVETQLDVYVSELNENIPFTITNMDTVEHEEGERSRIVYARDMATHMNMAYVVLRRIVVPQQRSDYFPRVVRELVFYFLQPWLAFKFLATFVPGDWNNITGPASSIDSSFNDRRYAEFAIFRAMMDIAKEFELSVTVLDMDNKDSLVEKMGNVTNTMLETIKDKYLRAEGNKLPEWYKTVSEESEKTKLESKYLIENNKDLTRRKKNLVTMIENEKRARGVTKRARAQFWIVTGIYIALVITLGILLFSGRYMTAYAVCVAMVFFAIVLYAVAKLVQWRNRKQKVNN